MKREIIGTADIDCIFLTYDEPKKEEFWIEIQNMVPWAKRVDGVQGSDAAHKAAADMSDTDWFILIDGDNLPDPEFFNLQLTLTEENKGCAFRWKARNHINGLMYGNGGMSCWSKEFVYNMKTHENSDGSADTAVEFCFDPKYIPMHNCYSTTYPNGSPFQAWRAGFREGVKMCLDRGKKPTLKEFEERVQSRNYDNLCIWQSVGADVENGDWAIFGARHGTYKTMFTDWDFTEVQWFDNLKRIWEEECAALKTPNGEIMLYGRELKQRLSLPIVYFEAENSKFFKHHYATSHKNLALMSTEMSVIRKLEGW
jgi:hypothetical protein